METQRIASEISVLEEAVFGEVFRGVSLLFKPSQEIQYYSPSLGTLGKDSRSMPGCSAAWDYC